MTYENPMVGNTDYAEATRRHALSVTPGIYHGMDSHDAAAALHRIGRIKPVLEQPKPGKLEQELDVEAPIDSHES
jgi:hypothetical protein